MPELLAPAGNYAGFLGAVHAGADAVYIGGKRFGARAYAENFTEDELCRAVSYAHCLGRKLYLTVNTLLREEDMSQLAAYLEPLYEAGLDAIIVQDLGVFRFCRKHFPQLPLHVSTQLCVTGSRSAAFLKEMGASRIVPARELSLQELKCIRQEADIELETFIHGAMCYSYSGQCLFSSILGGRSGNRGRCAQPCRLPYRILDGKGNPVCRPAEKEAYPLSLKDLCVIDYLPELIDAGIDSFKIEGRMKSPEYTAGVTAVYRKYIDLYRQCRQAGHYRVLEEDREQLAGLYIRTQVQDGYYHRHNGREMVTFQKPGYSGSDESLLQSVRSLYLEQPLQAQVKGLAAFVTGEAARLSVECDGVSAEVIGETVQQAQKQPLTDEVIRRQLLKTGQETFCFCSLDIRNTGDGFLPVKALNALRREAFAGLEKAMNASGRRKPGAERAAASAAETVPVQKPEQREKAGVRTAAAGLRSLKQPGLYLSFLQKEQIKALLSAAAQPDRIYLHPDCLEETSFGGAGGLWLPEGLSAFLHKAPETELYLAFPYGLRGQDCGFLDSLEPLVRSATIQGVMVRNLEELAWSRERELRKAGKKIVLDQSLYLWNRESFAFWREEADGWTAPLELRGKEICKLPWQGREWMIYGRIPMMITANCLHKTAGVCRRKWEEDGRREAGAGCFMQLEDRRRVFFPVYQNCSFCMNVIYNSVPLSLHTALQEGRFDGENAVRLDFTTEGQEETAAVLEGFQNLLSHKESGAFPVTSYTTGHFKKGTL